MKTALCGLELPSPFLLAPMAGITDSAYRTVCAGRGAALTYTEMVSAKALVYQDRKTHEIINIADSHRPCALQLFGSEPDVLAQAARIAFERSRPEIIDINMGCPVPKIVGNGEGSALMKNPALAEKIITAVVKAVPVPVTVKFRAGFYSGENIAAEFAQMAESAGAAAVCVHGRTRTQMYAGASDLRPVREAKEAVSIPVIASGDALSPRACVKILRETGADAVMIARGALGNPFIFEGAHSELGGQKPEEITAENLLGALLQHAQLACALKGESRAVPELRKHALWYLGRMAGAKPFKAEMSKISHLDELKELTQKVKSANLHFKGWADE